MSPSSPPPRAVSPRALREMFNDGDYDGRVATGELQRRVVSDRHPSSPQANVPYCTRSQLVQYQDGSGTEVATCHQYLQPDGTLGASGRPDPKRLFKDGILYVAWWGTSLGDR